MDSESIFNDEELEYIKAKVSLKKLRSNFILKKVFNNMKKIKILEILNYNKELQKRLNLNINDYKEYIELYSNIELELKCVKNKYNKFINISDKDKEYFHIYIGNSKEEIKRNHLEKNEKNKTIKIIIDYPIKSFKKLFYNCKCISSIFFKKFYRINKSNMSYMFYGCSSLKELNLTNFNSNKITEMSYMFSGCSSLEELNLSNFNTDKVKNMSYMFSGCSSLKELNLSNFNTNNVTNMGCMFYACSEQFQNKIRVHEKNIKGEAFNPY